MKKYTVPTAQVVVEFSMADIITVSGGLELEDLHSMGDIQEGADNVWRWN